MKNITKLACFTVFVFYLISCKSSDDELLDKIKIEIHKHINIASTNKLGYSIFNFSNITSFSWDKFYVFDEYVTKNDILKITGITFEGSSISSGTKRILFLNKNKIVKYVDFKPIEFPIFFHFCGSSDFYLFYKKDNPFIVFKNCSNNYCTFDMVPFRCKENFREMYEPKK